MLALTKQVDYAIQLIGGLKGLKENETVSLRTFAYESSISFPFLQRIARQLKQAGIIVSQKGKDGGYRLAREPRSITVQDLVDAIEGKTGIAACISNPGSCGFEDMCSSKDVIEVLNFEISELLRSVTAADF